MAPRALRQQECRPQAGQRELAISRSAELGQLRELRWEQRMASWPGRLSALSSARRQFPRLRVGLVWAASASRAPASRWPGRRRVRFPRRRRAWCAEKNLERGDWWAVAVALLDARGAEGVRAFFLQVMPRGAAGVAASRGADHSIAPANRPRSSRPSLPSRRA